MNTVTLNETEELKRQLLLERVHRAEADIAAGELIDGEEFMRDVAAGIYD